MDNTSNFITVMALDRARRRWRLGVFLLLLALLFIGFANFSTSNIMPKNYVAKVSIEGFITGNEEQVDTLEKIASDNNIKAVLIHVDSPGGTMVGGLNLYHAILQISESKPVVVTMGTVAASAGYMVAIAGDYIIANEATLTGSIGVFMPLVDATDFSEKIGIRSDSISSGALKSATSPFEKT